MSIYKKAGTKVAPEINQPFIRNLRKNLFISSSSKKQRMFSPHWANFKNGQV
jgi:hypothetical protein